MADRVREATSAADYAAFAALVTEYVQWCRDRYQADAWFINEVFGHQSLAREVAALATTYAPPHGRAFIAERDGQVCGAGAYRRLTADACEMKRLFVPPRFAGHGTGRALCDALLAAALADGYAAMRLDTGTQMTEAIAMYQSLGFRVRTPYHDYPAKLMPYLVFMERPLAA